MINKTMIVLAFGVLCIQTAFADREDCYGWRFESQYRTDWSDARSRCSYLDGELWRPTYGKWGCASNLVRRISGYIWTGAHRSSEKHSWKWTDGSSVYGEHWWPGEPNDAGDEDCVIVSDRGWNDELCRDVFMFVCQWRRVIYMKMKRIVVTTFLADLYPMVLLEIASMFVQRLTTATIDDALDTMTTTVYTVKDRSSRRNIGKHILYRLITGNVIVKACSWRSDSTRCYPGSCVGQLASKCKCTRGFSGSQCDEITESIKIMHAEAKLSDDSNKILTTPDDPNVPYHQPVKWSNNNKWNFLELDFSLNYHIFERPPKPDPTGEKHFVIYFKYDIVKALLEIEHRSQGVSRNNRMLNCCNGYSYPIFHITNCGKKKKFDIQSWGFQHADKLTITCTAENGGFLIYRDREDGNRDINVRLKGKTVQSSLVFRWDYITPYQECINGSKTDCNQPPVDCKDVSKQPDIKVRWGGWKDDLSGIDHFELELYELVSTGRHLNHINGPAVHRDEKISVHTSEQILKLPKPGMYSMILTSIDRAGNHQSARCLVFYDDISVVDIKHTKRIKVNEASAKTNFTWVSVDDVELSVTWTDRFLNERHEKHGWMYGVAGYVGVQEEYDDLYGPRKVSPIDNIHGIVKFEIKYEVYGPYLKANQSFTQTANVLSQAEYLNITWEDGYRLDITVKALDILDIYKDDIISVYKDVSPPVIQNLWLTKGDRVNISVHSMEDFSKMTIEWEAFDYASGLDQVEWRLYNNYTGIEEHGKATPTTQGESETLEDCINKYGSAPKGSSCYCTMFHGCYHKHFHIRPNIVKDSGITPGKEIGLHDSDYFIEVTVINKALLKTTKTIQISLDLSPPHEGYVHDGLKGESEVDFQQDLNIDAHWEGFFDKESGVDFYQYIFSDHCFSKNEMAISKKKQVTYNTYATYNATSEGIYFISVTAVNRASESSKVVCSDGVTVTTTIPFIKDFVFGDIKAKGQLLKDHNDTWWLLDSNLIRHRITELSGLPNNSTEMSQNSKDLKVFPEGRPIDKIESEILNTKSKSGIIGVLPTHQSFQIKWKSGVAESLIHDYAIGISSTPGSMAPDINSFHSSKHHNHFRIRHSYLAEGGEFYIIVKTTSRSGIDGYQSIGPFIVDKTPPKYINNVINVHNVNDYLLLSWRDNVFDEEDPFPLYYEYAVGHTSSKQDVQSFTSISSVGPCYVTYPPTCSAVLLSDLQWPLHVNHDYYITLRVTNVAGLSSTAVSAPFRYNIQLPSKGMVFDVLPEDIKAHGMK
ncbi:Hypothetical predicted protein, partial [Mytilus galloprovincialis]